MRARLLLALGALLGIFLASTGLIDQQLKPALSAHSIATVNGVDIPLEQYLATINTIEQGKQSALNQQAKDFVLQKMIDEELMVQRGVELGLLQLNSTLRNNIRLALIESILAEHALETPSEAQLLDFYQSNLDYFSPANQVRVRALYFDDQAKANEAYEHLQQGEAFESVKQSFASTQVIHLPDAWLSTSELRTYIGPTLTQAVFNLHKQQFSEPLANLNGWSIFQIIDKQAGTAPEFSSIKDTVENQYLRKQNEQAVKNYVDFLRTQAEIEIQALETLPSN